MKILQLNVYIDEYSKTEDNVYIYKVFENNQRYPRLHLLRKKRFRS